MNVAVTRRPIRTDGPSTIDQMAGLAIELVLCTAQAKNVALRAVIRLAGNALVEIEGHDAVSQEFARRSRIHAEANVRIAQNARRRT